MMVRLRRTLVVGVAVTMGPVGLAPGAGAGAGAAAGVAELCKQLDEAGALEALGHNRGECQNFSGGPASESASNFIAAICGFELAQDLLSVDNKGQCIKVLKG